MSTRTKGHTQAKPAKGNIPSISRLLEDVNKRITQLEAELKGLYVERDRHTRQIKALTFANAPIQQLPVEVMCSIFEHVVTPKEPDIDLIKPTHMDRTRALLVCKKWHNIIVRNPTLWTNILIKSPPYTCIIKNVEWVQSQQPRLERCIKRSKTQMLDIFVQLKRMEDGGDLLVAEMERQAMDMVPKGKLKAWVESNNGWDYWIESPIAKSYHEACFQVIRTIAGGQGEHMPRWRSLRLITPSASGGIRDMWEHFSYPAPNLQFFSLDELSSGEGTPLTEAYNIPFLFTVPKMELQAGAAYELTYIYPQVRSLKIWCSYDNFMALSNQRFPGLEELIIEYAFLDEVDETYIINIPHLQKLTLIIRIRIHFIEALDVGTLEILELVDDAPVKHFGCWMDTFKESVFDGSTTNDVTLFGVAQKIVLRRLFDDGHYDKAKLTKTLSYLFPQAKRTELIAVPESMIEFVHEMTLEWKGKGMLPALREIAVVDSDGNINSTF